MILVAPLTGIGHSYSDGLANPIVIVSSTIVRDIDGATAEGPLVHPIGRKSSNVSLIRVVVAAGPGRTSLVVVGRFSIVASRGRM